MRTVRERRRARGWALRVLYAWESRSGTVPILQMLREFEEEGRVAPSSRKYLNRLMRTIDQNLDEIDDELQLALTNWRLDRLAAIDRNILRIASAELLYIEDVPPLVSIQQAMEIAERYGTEESPRFINGVLDALLAKIEGRE